MTMKKLLGTKEASTFLKNNGVPYEPGSLEVLRHYGRGPAFKKIGRRIFYTIDDLEKFCDGETFRTVDSM